MLFLGYDPGGKGKHGVAALEVSNDGVILANPTCEVVEDAEAAWLWLSKFHKILALGIDTLLAWSPRGGRACDDALRDAYQQNAASVIPQNSLYSSMTINGAIVARRAARHEIPLFESHPKLLVRTRSRSDPATKSILAHYHQIIKLGSNSLKTGKQADDMADAVVAAWCAAQGFLKRWPTELYETPGDQLEKVAKGVSYPWPDLLD